MRNVQANNDAKAIEDSFPSCLKATAIDKGKKTSIAVCFSRLIKKQTLNWL